MTDIRDKCRLLKAGAIVITLAQQLESEYCQLLYTYSHQMTWGVCKVHVQTRYGKPKKLKADAEWTSNMYDFNCYVIGLFLLFFSCPFAANSATLGARLGSRVTKQVLSGNGAGEVVVRTDSRSFSYHSFYPPLTLMLIC
jgi:hypothetical protein